MSNYVIAKFNPWLIVITPPFVAVVIVELYTVAVTGATFESTYALFATSVFDNGVAQLVSLKLLQE